MAARWYFYTDSSLTTLLGTVYGGNEDSMYNTPSATVTTSGSSNLYVGDENDSNYSYVGSSTWTRSVTWVDASSGTNTGVVPGGKMAAYNYWGTYNFYLSYSSWTCTATVQLPYKTKTGYTQGNYKWSGGAWAYPPGTWLQGSGPGETWYLYPTFTKNVTYYIKYNANGGSGTMSNSTHVVGTASALTSNAFTYSGKVFTSWNTAADGTGSTYSNGASINMSATEGQIINLYAQWSTSTGWVYGAWQDCGSAQHRAGVQISVTAESETSITVKKEAAIFGWNNGWGWNIYYNGTLQSPNGWSCCEAFSGGTCVSGTYSVGPKTESQTITKTQSTQSVTYSASSYYYQGGGTSSASTTYTVPAITHYTVTYNAGDATSGTAPSAQTKWYGTALTLATNTGSLAHSATSASATLTTTFNANNGSTTKSSQTSTRVATTTYSNNGWGTSSGSTVKAYSFGGSYTANGAITLYPAWTTSTSYTYGSITFPTASQCTRTGYTLLGFNTSSSATSAAYSPGTSISPTTSLTYYAIWTLKTYSVNYAAGTHPSGSGTVSGTLDSQTKTYGVNLVLSSNKTAFTADSITSTGYTVTFNANGGTCSTVTKTQQNTISYSYSGWATSDGGSLVYSTGGTYSNNSAITLYPAWSSTTTTGKIVLPNATQSGYTFSGWYDSNNNYIGTAGTSYTPTANITLHAEWDEVSDPALKVKVNGEWKTCTPYVRVNNIWKRCTAYIKDGTWCAVNPDPYFCIEPYSVYEEGDQFYISLSIPNSCWEGSYSTDGINWSTIDGDPWEYGPFDIGQKIYIRGHYVWDEFQPYADSDRIWFQIYGDNSCDTIKLSGSLENLVAYELDSSIPFSSLGYIYQNLFSEAYMYAYISDLIFPSGELPEGCCFAMFAYNTILDRPNLPSVQLAENCYREMFYQCSIRSQLPELNATTLPNYCYYSMFYDCEIFLSASYNSGYNKPFVIPATSIGTDSLTDMFSGTLGEWSGPTPTSYTTYWQWVPEFKNYYNLIDNPTFDSSTYWRSGTVDSTHYRSADSSYKKTGTSGSSETYIYTQTYNPDITQNHIYYARFYTYYTDSAISIASTQIYWPEAEPSMGYGSVGSANQWVLNSFRAARSNWSSGSYPLRIDFNNEGQAGDMWFDDMILLDLTETYGSGNEPTQAWCDANIGFFTGGLNWSLEN